MRAYVLAGRPDKEGDVVELVSIYSSCVKFNTLPGPGGLLDQPGRLMYLLECTATAYAEQEANEAKRQEAEAKRSRK